MTLLINGEVPFPSLGEGHFFCFTLRDIAELEQTYGIGEAYFTIEANLAQNSASTALRCLEVGLKTRDKNGKRVRVEIDPDGDFPPVSEMFKPIMDALSWATAGKSHDDLIEEMKKQLEEAQKRNLTLQKEAAESEDDPLAASGARSGTKQSDTGPA